MAKYQEFLSRVGSNRDRAALRGIFSQFLTDGDPPALKDLVLASIVLSGAETTQITISGASTTGILQSGTSTTGYSITGAFTTGISIAADGTTAIEVTSAFSGVTGFSFAGTASGDGILISGACADALHISGTNTASAIHISGDQVIGMLMDVDAAWTDGIKILVDDGITLTTGINIDRTGTTGICTTAISIDTDGTTGIEIAAGFTGVTGLSIAGTASGDGILISGACADGIHISGTNTASGLHISGDQVSSILIDVDAAVDNVISVSVDDGITATVGINIARTGTTGICTTGIMIDTDGTTALWIGTGFTGTTGVLIAGTATNGISITGATTTGISVSGACTTAINIARATAKTAIRVGEWAASQAAGSAVVFATNMAGLDTSQLNIIAVFGESTSDLTGAYSTSVIRGRHLVSAAADTEITHEVYGVMGQVVCKNASFNHYASGIMGTFEPSNTLTHVMSGYVVAAVTGRIGGAVLTVESGGIVAGVAAIQHQSAFTATGKLAGFATHKTATGLAWPIGLYMPSGSITQGIQIGASTSDPITTDTTSTVNMVEVNTKHTGASGVVRGILSHLEFSGTNVGAGLNTYAIRGYAKVSGTIAGGSSVYVTGVQGKAEVSGTMTGGRVCGLLGQIAAKGSATVSGGEIACLWLDNQYSAAVGSGNTMSLIHMETSDASINTDQVIAVYGKCTQFLNFLGAYTDYVIAGSTVAGTPNVKLKCKFGTTTFYLQGYDS